MTSSLQNRIAVCAAACITAGAALMSCTVRDDKTAVPKPEGWPRIEVPAQNYTDRTIGGINLRLNSEATANTETRVDGNQWIDITYPQFRQAKIYLTLSSATADEMQNVLANRHERMELNTGGALTELTELTSEGEWQCELAMTRNSLTTPLQLLAHDSIHANGIGHVLSGALYLDVPPHTAPDSIAPIVRAIKDDMLTLLKHLRRQ